MSSFRSGGLFCILRRTLHVLPALAFCMALACAGQDKPADKAPAKPAANAAPDVLVLADGDTLHGKLVNVVDGTVKFHTADLGDLSVKWSSVKELHTGEAFGVFTKSVRVRGRKDAGRIPLGRIDVENQSVIIRAQHGATPASTLASIPEANASYVVDEDTLDKQIYHHPNFLTGWNGAATAGVTIVEATQAQHTASGSIGMVRTVPTVSWLDRRNRTSADFSGSYGTITEPGVPTLKTSIYHANGERDEYFSPRFFALGQVAFDHNFSLGLALQSIFGGGIGFMAFKTPSQELDLNGTIQYASQQFLAVPPLPAAATQHLAGSTFSLSYTGKWKYISFTQTAAYIPSWNVPRAYSASETNTLAFPAYKNFSFSMGTLNSYLNDPPVAVPPTKRNSFQFTMGLTYAIKSKY
jgi:hypothetical protein